MAGHADFVHLHCHSAFSLAEGAIKLDQLIDLAKSHRMPAVAMTDTDNMFGALGFAMAAAKAGVQPILGVQMSVARIAGDRSPDTTTDHLVLLVQDRRGWVNLMKIVSRAYLEGDTGMGPVISLDAMTGLTDGLLCLTGGHSGPVGHWLAEGRNENAQEVLDVLQALFPGRLYIEIQRHGLDEQSRIELKLVDMAFARDLPLVATNDCMFADSGMYEAHDALLCIADGRYIQDETRRRVTKEHRFKSAGEMRQLFADLPEAVDNTIVIARRCSFLLKPIDPILPVFPTEGGCSETEELAAQARAGLEKRLLVHVYTDEMDEAARAHAARPYFERLDYELGIIEQMGFPGYFLIVSDFIKWAKTHDIPVGPGRGSGAGSVVAWSLTITDLDPLRFGLLFERFLNPERVSMPDFDVDFCQDRRDEVIRYTRERYGDNMVAQIITYGKLQARAVTRDVGRVLQMPFGQVDSICKMIPNPPGKPVPLADAIEGEPRIGQMMKDDETVAKLMNVALKLEGLYRHASTHAAGVVIGDRPLEELVPLYRDPRSDMPVTQFSMKYVEMAGLVKFDFLGLKTLTVLQRAVENIKATTGEKIDLSTLPMADDKTFKLLTRTDTMGVFQLESPGMRDVLRKLKPDRFEELIALVALYRPGPMDNIPKYIRVKNGEEPADYLHPDLEPILKETFGIIIYQEQVMQAAQVLAGYTLGGADLLRRAMGKKIKEAMDEERVKFVSGAKARGVDSARADSIFDQIAKFAGYGFNKSHAAAYALIAWQTAWLKANYPVQFMAASMSLDIGNTEKLNLFRQELNSMGIALLAPDVNRSDVDFAVERQQDGTLAIRYAFSALKGVGRPAARSLTKERENGGLFASLSDFARRFDPHGMNKRQLDTLIASGGF
ncbi:MAG: DNA polymerase III subunit alpha, partial [Pseudomonadota bacterium]|nr:DNA polymerase III subunit alpha [Pseudomonadota bacterium]